MSTTVDERVVEMRFDNKHFESNVATSMSTLDKLKQKLNLSGASKGLEDIDRASKKVDMSGLGGAVESVSAKFSALQVIGIAALANITNSAVNAGKRMISALTIDPVMSGFKEYETQINAVQTILANTSSKGTTINDVTAALDELNKYADLTIYNFTEMTRNIGTFTAAGIDLDTSVNAIQGIANLAAVSGSTSQQASVAMYQLSQALASGTVKLMDWNSVVNAGMGGEVFQNALKETSRLLGTGADAAIKAKGSFRESLSTGWLTAEVLTETLKKFTESGANEYVAEYTGLSVDAVQAALDNAKAQYGEAEAIDKAAEALAEKSGKNKDEIKSVLQMAQTATDAATKVKTFSQLWDVMKEAVQSGWAKTWQIIIGDFEEAKALLTPLADFFTNIINKMSDARNNLLESALGKGFTSLGEKINGVLKPATKAVETVTKLTSAVTDLGDIVNRVIRGDFGNGAERVNALTEAGINYYKVQNKVNETLNNGFRYTDEQIESQDKLLGVQQEAVETTETGTEATIEITDAQKDQIKTLAKLSDAELKAKGYTDEQIEAFRELRNTAEELGIPLEEFIDNLDQINGRWLLMNSFKNIGKALLQVFKSIGEAWRGVFDPIQADQVFNVIAAIHKFTASLVPSEDTADKLTRTFKGLFAILDIITTVVGGGIKIAFKVLSQILSYFHLDILDVTAAIGDALVAFHDWFDSIFGISGILDAIVPLIQKAANAIREWYDAFKETSAVQKLLTAIETIRSEFSKLTSGEINIGEFAASLGKGLANAIKSLPGMALQIGKDFIAGFQNGIGDGIRGVIKKVVDFCINFVKNFASALGVHSPSWKAYEIAEDFFQGFINGTKSAVIGVINFFKAIGEKIVEIFKSLWDFLTDENGNIDWNKIFAGGSLLALILVLKKFSDVFGAFAGILDSVQGLIGQASVTLQNFGKVLNGVAWDLKAEALKKMAISIAILVAAIWVLCQIDDVGKMWIAVGVIVALAVILVGLAFAMDKLSAASVKWDKGPQIEGIKSGLLQIGIVILLVAAAVKLIGDMDSEKAERGFKALGGIAVGMIVFMAAMAGISRYAGNVKDIGKMVKDMAIAMLLMVIVCKLAGSLSAEQMLKGALFAGGFVGFVAALVAVTKISSDKTIAKISGMLLSISFTMMMMVGVCKLAALLSLEDMAKGALFAGGFVGFVAALVAVTKIADGQKMAKISALMLSLSVSLLILVGVCKLVGMLSPEEMIKGGIFISSFLGFMVILVGILKISNKQKMAEVSKTIIAMSLGIAVLAGVCVLLSFVDNRSLAKGIIAVGMLSLMMSLMVHSLKGAKNAKDAMKWMAVSIVAMAAAVVALSFIDDKDLAKAVGSMVALMGMFALMMKSLKGLTKVPVAPIIMMIGVIIALAGVMYLLGELDPKTTISTVASLAILMLAMAGVLKILNGMNADIKNAAKGAVSLATLAIPLAAFALVLKLLDALNVDASIKNVGALILLATACTLLLAPLTLIGQFDITSVLKGVLGLLAMAVPLLAFVGVLALMQNVQNAMNNVAALVILSTALTLLLIPLTLIGALIYPALLGVLALTAMAVPLLAFVAILAIMQHVDNATSNVQTLITLAATLTLLLIPLTLIGALIYPALLGVLALTAMAVPLLAFVGILAIMQNIQNAMANALVLTTLMTAIGDVLVKIALVGPLAIVGVTALYALVALMGVLAVVATAIGALVTQFPQLETFLDTGIPILQKLASGLGLIIGSFVTAFAGEVMTILPQLGLCLSQFMLNATPFIVGAKMIDESVLTGVGILSAAIIALTAAELLTGVTSFLTGGSSFADLGSQLSQFMLNAMPFIAGALLITPDMLSGVRALADTILILTAADLLQGITSFITGGSSLESFATQLPILGRGLAGFSESLVTFTDEQLATVNCAAQAIKTLAEASAEIPNTGGLLGDIVGDNDLGVFAAQFPVLGSGLRDFLNNVGAFTDEQVATVNCAAEAIKSLAEASSEIPNSGGLLGDIVGDNDLGAFAEQFPILGTGLRGFLDNVGTFTDEQVATVNCAADAIKSLASAASEIPNSGGWIGAIVGENDLGTFADQFPKLGTGLSGFLTNVGTFTDEQVATVNAAANAVATLASAASSIPNEGGWISKLVGDNNLGTFASNFPKLGEGLADFVSELGTFNNDQLATVNSAVRAIKALSEMASLEDDYDDLADSVDELPDIADDLKSFCSKMPSNESATSAVDSLKKILSALDDISDVNSGCLATFAENLKKIGKEAVQKFVDAFTSNSAKTDLKDAAKTLGKQVVDGLESKEKDIKTAAEDAAKKAVDGAKTQKDEMKSAGKDLGSGLVKGIEAKWDAAYDAGYTLGKKAVQGEKDGQNSNSPSKDTIKAGKWLGEGLIIGIKTMGRSVYQAGETMGSAAINATRSAMSTVLEALNSDMDAQPTIRPVVDLSDVRSGASAINGMFSGTQGIGVQANLSAINVAMNRKLQNGSNDDVISAINKLNDSLEGNRGDTYNFAGITYDNGDEISNAVQTLVRAAKMGRRV